MSAHSIFNTHFSSSSSKAVLSADRPEGTGDPDLPPWVEALVFIRRFGDGQGAPGAPPPWTASCVYPPEALPASVLADVLSVALPRRPILRGKDAAASSEQSRDGTGSAVGSQQKATDRAARVERFLFRVRDRNVAGSNRDPDSGRDSPAADVLLDRDGSALGPAVGRHTVFWNCFVLYSQRMLAPTAAAAGLDLLCESLLLVTRWPCLELAHQMLSR